MLFKIGPLSAQDECLISLLLKIALHRGRVDPVRFGRMKLGENVRRVSSIARLLARLADPVLHHHCDRCSSATFFRLLDERNIEPDSRISGEEEGAKAQGYRNCFCYPSPHGFSASEPP